MKKVADKIWPEMKKIAKMWWKKAIILCLISLVIACCLEWLQVQTQPAFFETRISEKKDPGIMDPGKALLTDCAFDGQTVTVDEGPAQIFFSDFNNHFSCITIKYSASSEEGVMRVLFAKAGEECDIENSVQLAYSSGEDTLVFYFPEGDYGNLKIQIAGKVKIKEIERSVTNVERIPIRDPFNWKRAAKVAVLLFTLLVLLCCANVWTKVKQTISRVRVNLLSDKKNTLIHAAIFFGTAIIVYFILRAYLPYVLGKEINRISNLFIISISIAAGCLFCFRETLAKKAEIFFLIFSLLIGGNIAFFAPDTSNVSWDDGYHYQQSNSYSYLGDIRLTAIEQAVLQPWPEMRFDVSGLDEWHGDQNELYQAGVSEIERQYVIHKSFWSSFSGIGLYLGRVIGLPFHQIWEFGRFAGLLAYSIIGYFAIRRLKSGKMILMSFLMIPENLFLAASYSYDPGLTVLFALGLSYLFAEWQEREKKLTWLSSGIIIGSLYLGCFPKEIFFPILLFPLFLPKDKFRDSRQRFCFMGLTIAAMLLLVLSFVPSMGSRSDMRGGDEVNASAQISFILNNPLSYTIILTNFLKTYLHPDGMVNYLTFFAYFGKGPNSSIYLVALAIAAFSDKSPCDDHFARKGWMRAFFMFVLFGIVCLVATSMYVAFTPVGYETINGCQCRYILPLFYPALMLIGVKGIHNHSNRKVYNGIILVLISYVGFTSVLYQFINLYA